MTHSGFATMAAVVPQMSEGYSREGWLSGAAGIF